MGFLWTTEDVYPWLYRSSDQAWIEFKGSYDGKRGFLNSNTGEVEVWTIPGEFGELTVGEDPNNPLHGNADKPRT